MNSSIKLNPAMESPPAVRAITVFIGDTDRKSANNNVPVSPSWPRKSQARATVLTPKRAGTARITASE